MIEQTGEPTAEDIEALKKTRSYLIEKRNELLKKRDSYVNQITQLNSTISEELKDYNAQREESDRITEIFERLPSEESQINMNNLRRTKKELEAKLLTLNEQVKAQMDEKELLIAQIYGHSPTKVWKKSLSFLHQSLLDELSEMVKMNAVPEILRKKEQQIRYCEYLTQ